MAWQVSEVVWDRYQRGGGEKLLALFLAKAAKPDGTTIWPSVATMSHRTGLTERTVQAHLTAMRKSGWLEVTARPNGGRKPTEYRINPLWLSGVVSCTPSGVVSCTPQQRPGVKAATLRGDGFDTPPVQETTPEQTLNLPVNRQTTTTRGGGRSSSKEDKGKRAMPFPVDFGISDRVRTWAKSKGYTARSLDDRLSHFRRWAETANRVVDWDKVFMDAIEGDWAGLGKPIDLQRLQDDLRRAAETEQQRERERHEAHEKYRRDRQPFVDAHPEFEKITAANFKAASDAERRFNESRRS